MSSGGHLRGWREEYMRGVGVWSACGGLECGVYAGGSSADLVGWRACTVLECGGHVEYWSAELMQGVGV